MKIKKLAVVGSGPSGLLAVHAAILSGVPNVDIWTRSSVSDPQTPGKSSLYGCQYLHSDIPGLTLRSATVSYELVGTAEEYRRKVYGPEATTEVSPEGLEGEHQAWDIRSAYDQLWKMYVRDKVGGVQTFPGRVNRDNIGSLSEGYDLVISTIPADQLCINEGHIFSFQEVWAVGDAPDLGIAAPVEIESNRVVCNGLPDTPWYRASSVFGMTTVEWSGLLRPIEQAVRFRKPLDNDCNCPGPNVVRMGRYGAWRKGILAHDVYDQTRDLVLLGGDI